MLLLFIGMLHLLNSLCFQHVVIHFFYCCFVASSCIHPFLLRLALLYLNTHDIICAVVVVVLFIYLFIDTHK